MTNRSFLIILFFLLFARNTATASPGFRKLNAKDVPAAVKVAARSVFRGLLLYGKPQLELSPDQYDDAIARLKVSQVDSTAPILSRIGELQAALVQICKINKLPVCRSGYPLIDSGSFFVVGDKRTLVTARHVVDLALSNGVENNYVAEEEICQMRRSGLELRIILLDSKDKIVFETVNGLVRSDVVAIGNPKLVGVSLADSPLAQLGEDNAFIADDVTNDFVIIKTSGDMPARPLRWARDDSMARGPFFALGYPAVSTNRALDSDGRGIRVTTGKRVTRGKIFLATKDWNHPEMTRKANAYLAALNDNALVCDADLNVGQSGGPVVDSQGQVHGVIAGGIRNEDQEFDVAPPRATLAVRPFAIKGVRDLIEDFAKQLCE